MTGMKPPVKQRRGAVGMLIAWLPRVALAIIFLLVGALNSPSTRSMCASSTVLDSGNGFATSRG